MPLGTLDRTPPPFFRQGPSALAKLALFSALALFLMVADVRFKVTAPLRSTVATVLYPVQWLAQQPMYLLGQVGGFFTTVNSAQNSEALARARLAEQSIRAGQADQLRLENERLRALLELRKNLAISALAAEVLYDAPDIYSRKLIIDKGAAQSVELGSAVMDSSGVLGQVTRVYPVVSEVTLLTDRDQAIPVLNTRTGARSVAYGDPLTDGGVLELRFIGATADVAVGDQLSTSGVDGVYPPGLPVGKVLKVERRADTAFAHIYCAPAAAIAAAKQVMIIKPIAAQIAPRPAPEPDANAAPGRRGASRARTARPEATP